MGIVVPNVYFTVEDYYVLDQNNLNISNFDGLQIYREEYGQSFQYDEKGNVVSTVDLVRKKSTFEYNTSSDLVKYIDPKEAHSPMSTLQMGSGISPKRPRQRTSSAASSMMLWKREKGESRRCHALHGVRYGLHGTWST